MAYRPRIGLTMRLELETQRFYLGRDYSEAIQAAGGVPVHIPLIPDRDYISSLSDGLDGVLLPGCDSDVDPLYYGEEPHPKLGRVVPEKDETDLMLLEEVEARNLPLLAICYGIQVLNVSRGGNLIQDIESQVENCIKHGQGKPYSRKSHTIRIESGSLLSKIGKDWPDDGSVKVNSHHHQAIKSVGKNLRPAAWAQDGVIEFVEDTRPDRFVLGVQWHPELAWNMDPVSKSIFEAFVSKCSEYRQSEVANTGVRAELAEIHS